jgi:NADPH-dependent ferric siderophore reductase
VDQTPSRPSQHQLRVIRTADLTASMRRVTLHAPTLARLALRPAQDVGLVLTDARGRPARKRYTIRNVDPAAETLDLDGILHGHGPGAQWFASAREGDVVDVVGPRGKIEIEEGADWHYFVGDESGLPAFAELVAGLPAGAVARVLVEVTSAADEYPIKSVADVQTTWIHRGSGPAGTTDLLAAAIRAAELPDGVGQAYLLGESRSAVVLRGVLGERGLVGQQVFLKGYWNSAPMR